MSLLSSITGSLFKSFIASDENQNSNLNNKQYLSAKSSSGSIDPHLAQLSLQHVIKHIAVESNTGTVSSAGNIPITGTVPAKNVTPQAAKVESLVGVAQLFVTRDKMREAVDVLKHDPNLSQTIKDLHSRGQLDSLFFKVSHTPARRDLVELMASNKLDKEARAIIEPHIGKLESKWQATYNLDRMDVPRSVPTFDRSKYDYLIGKDKTDAFTGVGATGWSPKDVEIPYEDQLWLLLNQTTNEKESTERNYSNPLAGVPLGLHLETLTSDARKAQVELVFKAPVNSTMGEVYGGRFPTRADVVKAAAKAYNLEPELIAAFIMAEQRDQSQLEDGKDYKAAVSIARADTSIGLGQVKVSTAKNYDLFAKLMSEYTRKSLGHVKTAELLTDDAVNIFAVAAYIRKVADAAGATTIDKLPQTKKVYPGLNLEAFKRNSSEWPADNIEALGSEYTSKPWDDKKLFPGWGYFVHEAYKDVKGSGVFK
jgi:hypothetical protein